MQFDHLRANPVRCLDLAQISGDKNRHSTSGLAQRRDEMRDAVFFSGNFQTAFGGALFALFGH